MPRYFTQTFGVVGAMIKRDGKFLLVKEDQRKDADAGKWSHPAGWIDVGEIPEEACAREVAEESGYAFTPTHLVGIYSLDRQDLKKEDGARPHAIKLIYTGTISEKPVRELEGDTVDVGWFTKEEIMAMDASILRDMDIQTIVKDLEDGTCFPLEAVKHTAQI